ncbi:MAG: phosphoribosylglycinamide formyltransferase [Candidatus Omnitrophota bacterium]
MNIAVFASGKGTNFNAIIKAVKNGLIKANLSVLICDNPSAGAIQKAKRAGIEVFLLKPDEFSGRKDFENKISCRLEKSKIDLIVLAGFMRILSPEFVHRYKGMILNIHPSLLPSFKGKQAIKDAFDYGVKITGVTVHFVDEEMDHGPIILQEAVLIKQTDTLESLETRIHKIEHKLYTKAISLFVEGRLKTEERKIYISPPL